MGLFDEVKEPTIFQLGVDETARAYLLQTVRWTKFMAILGIIFSALLVLLGSYSIMMASGEMASGGGSLRSPFTTGIMGGYLALVGLYVYPIICLFRFSRCMKSALNAADTGLFNEALRYQRNFWRYLGVLMISLLVLYGVIIIAVVGYFAVLGR